MKEIELLGKRGNKTKNEINLKESERKRLYKKASKQGRQAGSHPSFDLCTCRPLSRLFYSSTGGGTVEFFFFFFLFIFFFLLSFRLSLFSFSFFFSLLPLVFFFFSAYSLIPWQSVPAHSRSRTRKHTHTHTHTKDEHDAISVIITGDVTP
jgi:hypothetical protein